MDFEGLLFQKSDIEQHSKSLSLSEEKVWFIEKGSCDIFAIEKEKGKPQGIHHFLLEASKGQAIFGFPQNPKFEITAVAEPKSVIKSVDTHTLMQYLLEKKEHLHAFIPFFNLWIGELCKIFVRYRPKEEVLRLSSSQPKPFVLQQGEKILFDHFIGKKEKQKVRWMEMDRGALCPLGWSDVKLQAPCYMPVRSGIWWQVLESASLTPISLASIIEKGEWQTTLSQFNEWFLKALSTLSLQGLAKEKKILEDRSKLEERVLKASFRALASVLQKEEEEEEEKKDPLFLACAILGHKQDIHFKEPKRTEPDVFHQLAEICVFSSVRYRQISLEGRWWSEDSGDMLGFYGEKNQPVALFREKKGYYAIHPKSGESEFVDEKVAQKISPVAFVFYTPFPIDTYMSGKALLNFGYSKLRRKIGLVFFIGLAISILDLVLPFGSKIIFGVAIPQLNQTMLWQIGLGIILAAIASGLYQFSQGLLIFYLNTVAGNRIECAQWDRILKLPVSFFKKYSVGDLWSRIYGFVSIRRTFNNYYITLLFRGLFSVLYLVAMGYFSLHLTVIAVLISACVLTFAFTCMHLMLKYQSTALETRGIINGFIIQVIQGINKIKNAGGEKRVFSHWARLYSEQKKNDLKGQIFNTYISTAFAALPSFALLCIFSVMIYYIYQTQNNPGVLSVSRGDFFGFVTAFGAFSSAILGSVPAITTFYRKIRPLSNRAKAIFKEPVEEDPQKVFAKKLEGNVFIEDISFRYDINGPLILKNISLRAHAGEFVGIVGPSGSGKSTLIRLLLGFEKPEKGSIYYDNEDLAHLDARSIRRQIGTVLQHGSVLEGTIYENLVYGGIYSKEQVLRAVKLSGFDADLESFPMGLHTVVSSGGNNLSGGQRQRLMIARALISNPKILLFDEATSALDNRSQELIRKNIEKLQVTRIVIAHRLSTIRHSDRIYVMDNGEIVDQGTFDELYQRRGKFAEFVQKQKL